MGSKYKLALQKHPCRQTGRQAGMCSGKDATQLNKCTIPQQSARKEVRLGVAQAKDGPNIVWHCELLKDCLLFYYYFIMYKKNCA